MTPAAGREVFAGEGGSRRGWNPTLTIRVVHIVLWLLVISGPVAALLVATQVSSFGERLDVVDIGAGVEVLPDTSGAEGFAELFIATYLAAGDDSADGFSSFLDGDSPKRAEGGSWSVTRTTSLGAVEVAPGYYAVTVAAEVVAADSDSDRLPVWVPVGTRFYSVGVAETESGWAIVGFPSLITAPVGVAVPKLLIDRRGGLDANPGLEEMLSRFLAAYVAGDGELARYTSPSSPIVSVQPPPFTGVEILEAGMVETSAGVTEVAVLVRATDGAGRAQVLEYSLVVEQRDGRWEVSHLLPVPPLATPQEGS